MAAIYTNVTSVSIYWCRILAKCIPFPMQHYTIHIKVASLYASIPKIKMSQVNAPNTFRTMPQEQIAKTAEKNKHKTLDCKPVQSRTSFDALERSRGIEFPWFHRNLVWEYSLKQLKKSEPIRKRFPVSRDSPSARPRIFGHCAGSQNNLLGLVGNAQTLWP